MFIDTNQLGDEPHEFERAFEPGKLVAPDPADEAPEIGEVRLSGRIEPDPRGPVLSGLLQAELQLVCARCLEPFKSRVSTNFRLILVRDPIPVAEGETGLDWDELSLFHAEGGRVDLGEIAREQLYLNLPLKPVCEAGCLGLCPTCGGNRNRIRCACRSEAVDPRLAPLLELKKRRSDG
jgi:uncharacterized protein